MSTVVVAIASAVLAFPATNLELAEQVVTEACAAIPDSLLDSGFSSIRLEITGEHPGNWLVEQCVKTELDRSGLTVLTAESPRDAGEPDLEQGTARLLVRPMELSVLLGSTSRSWFVGPRRVERIASCELYSELVDPSGSVITSLRSSSSRSDRVSVSDLSELKGSSGEVWLTGGEPQAGTGGLLEPLVVTGVVASLIYLFYSSRAE